MKQRARKSTRRPSVAEDLERGPLHYFSRHPVFRFDEFAAANEAVGRSRVATRSALRYHVSTGRLLNPRRGLYCSAANAAADPWVLGSKLATDAVLAWDAALSFHGLTGLGHQMTIMTKERIRHFVFGDVIYRSCPTPVGMTRDTDLGVDTVERAGEPVRVTALERTLVDCLDRLDLGPGLQTLWDEFAQRPLDGALVARAACQLGSQVTAARVGLFLHFHPLSRTPRTALDDLRALAPRQSTYIDRANPSGDERPVSAWRLLVPRRLLASMERALARR